MLKILSYNGSIYMASSDERFYTKLAHFKDKYEKDKTPSNADALMEELLNVVIDRLGNNLGAIFGNLQFLEKEVSSEAKEVLSDIKSGAESLKFLRSRLLKMFKGWE